MKVHSLNEKEKKQFESFKKKVEDKTLFDGKEEKGKSRGRKRKKSWWW